MPVAAAHHFPAPDPGDYLVEGYFFSDRGHGDVSASVGVFVDGMEARTLTRRLTRTEPAEPYWAVAEIRVGADGSIQVVGRDETGDTPYSGP